MGNELVSVIIPIYNTKEYLDKCIESVINQTYRNLEIILVDDGSTDGSGELCDKFAIRDSRIRVIHKKNEGLVKARKIGISNASGNLIGYVDSDDWIEPDMYEKLYEGLSSNKADISMCGRYEDTKDYSKEVYHGFGEGFYNKDDLLNNIFPTMITDEFLFDWKVFPGLWDKLFRRDAIYKYQMLVDERLKMGEDAACTYPALLNCSGIYILHECLYHYRQTNNSMVKSTPKGDIEREQFCALYHSVNNIWGEMSFVYDLRSQWLKYVMFLMVPRLDNLYEGYYLQDYLIPFKTIDGKKVVKNSNIIIYGAGTYGQRLYKVLKESGFCNVIAVLDRNYKQLASNEFPVVGPERLGELDFDYLIVANTYYKSRMNLVETLKNNVSQEKIAVIDEEMILSEKTLKQVGLI